MKKLILGGVFGFAMIGVIIYLIIYEKEIYSIISGIIVGWSLMTFGKHIAEKFID